MMKPTLRESSADGLSALGDTSNDSLGPLGDATDNDLGRVERALLGLFLVKGLIDVRGILW